MKSRRNGQGRDRSARIEWLGIVVLCCLLALAGTPAVHAGQPSITWSPSTIAITIGNGTSVTRDASVTVTSSVTLTDVDLWVVPEVSPFVSLQPSHLATMTAGTAYQVRVHYTIPPGAAPGTYEGTVHVRTGSRTLPQTLKVVINVDYGNIVIPSSTHVVSAVTAQYLTSVTDASLTFSTMTDELQQVAPGDVIVIAITPLTPGGLLRKVTGVQVVDGQVVIATTSAALADAIQTGSLQVSEHLTPPSSASAAATQRGVSLTAHATAQEPTGFYQEIKDVVLYDADGDLSTTNDQITADGSISVDPHVDFALDIQDFQFKQVSFVATATQSSQLTIKSEVELGSVKKKYQIAQYPLDPMIIWVGYVPVVIEPVLSFNVGVDGKVSVGITTGVTEKVTAKAGLTYDNGSWSPVSDLTIDITGDPPGLSAGCDVKGYAGPQISFLLYGVAGPYAELDGYVELEADLFATPWWELYGGFEVGVGVRVAILDTKIVDYYDPSVIGYRQLLLQATTPPPAGGGIVNGSFETTGGWTVTTVGGDCCTPYVNLQATDGPYDGSYYAWLGDNLGNYGVPRAAYVDQTFTVPPGATTLTFAVKYWQDTWGAELGVKLNGTKIWVQGSNGSGAHSSDWALQTVDISAYQGQSVTLEFYLFDAYDCWCDGMWDHGAWIGVDAFSVQ